MRVIHEREFKNKLSLFDAVMLGVGSTIGAGIFILLSPAINLAGPAVIIAFIFNAFIAFIIAGNYAEAASFSPVEGGGFSFVEEVYGRKALFLGWIIWLGNASYAALVSIGVAKLVSSFLPINELFISVSTLLLFTFLNTVGVKKVALIEKPLALLLIIALLAITLFLFMNPANDGFTSFSANEVLLIIPATSLLFVCFTGFEAIATISAEIKKPRINVPKALLYTVGIVTIIYLTLITAMFYSTSTDALSGSKIALLEAVKSSSIMQVVVIASAVIAMLSVLNVTLMAASRNIYALSRDGFLPKSLSDINQRFESPLKAVLLTFFISLILVFSNQVGFVASVSNLSYMIIVSSVGFAVLKLRKFEDKDTFKLPFHPLGSILCIILPIILIPFLEWHSLLIGLAWLIIGLIINRYNKQRLRKPKGMLSPAKLSGRP